MQQDNDSTQASRPNSLRFRKLAPNPREQQLIVSTLFLFGFVIALTGLIGGFIYGDYYGRKHAQYDNPSLREYYAGQCYSFWENQFKKTVRSSLEKSGNSSLQNDRLEEIRSMIQDLQHDIADQSNTKGLKGARKKVASSGLMN
jgi:hypothetical protein